MDYKIIISVISVALVVVGYGPYVYDILKRKTTPHVFTWFIWTLAPGITYALQVKGGAGVGAWVTFGVTISSFIIFILSMRIGDKDITHSDIAFFILSLCALFLWLGVDKPIWSVILIVLTDVLGFFPTIRKSWNKPHSETLFTWGVASFRHTLGIFALQKFNLLTLLYPVVWAVANLIFCIILIIRRRVIKPRF